MPEPHFQQSAEHLQQNGLTWWHSLWGLLLTPLTFKRVRDFLFGWLKKKIDREDCMPRNEFEMRIKNITDDLKDRVSETEDRILSAFKENIGNLREDAKAETSRTDKRLEFLEKVFLDSRLAGK